MSGTQLHQRYVPSYVINLKQAVASNREYAYLYEAEYDFDTAAKYHELADKYEALIAKGHEYFHLF